jgi:nitroreductase
MSNETTRQQILEAFHFRHACKQFDPERKISDEDFRVILEAARLSPSSFGLEPWKFIVLQNAEIRKKLLPFTWGGQGQIPTASHFVIVLARTAASLMPDSPYMQYVLEEVKKLPEEAAARFKQRFHNFLENEFQLLHDERLLFEWACRQTYIALGNMMTVAAQLGIDSCPIEGFDKQKAEQLLQEEGLLEEGQFGVSCMVAFGYRAQEPRPKIRQGEDRIIRWVN